MLECSAFQPNLTQDGKTIAQHLGLRCRYNKLPNNNGA
jgi:hypothetical protein